MRVLAGDIGGTTVRLQVAEIDGAVARVAAEWRVNSADYDGLGSIISECFSAAGLTGVAMDAACFGIAGPVQSEGARQSAKVTNLPWVIDSDALARVLGNARVRLINDFQALGYAVEGLTAADVFVLQAGVEQPHAPRVVVGAGTGLGQGILIWDGDHYEAIATEGGHVDFAPTDALQQELLQFLASKFGRVSYERILSGPGIANVYTFLSERAGRSAALLASADPAAAITDAALAGSDPVAAQALALFVRIYGAQAGNVALSVLAHGGVYIGGGIAPKILPALSNGDFMRAFVDKGRMAALLAAMPVRVIVNTGSGLLGASLVARRLARARRASGAAG